ncbi:DNA-protecting protein DprA [Candidatus Peregrinibacteria bacterium]|nr:DNA-protecting protein DprA [Candidatus Peregrinibacteria bacterium]
MSDSSFSTLWEADRSYPPLLRQTHRAPKRLFAAGLPLDEKGRYFAIVGTRHPSPYGKEMAHLFAYAIARAGFAVVSGLAYGIDAIAHEAALAAGKKTLAVLGSGLDHITPFCNHSLAERIKKNGAILTEFERHIPPNKKTFPQRNRIIAGMSEAVLIIEAPEHSGALITARFGLEYNRDVFVLPGNITQETSIGGNRLIRDCKAFPVTCVEDIFGYMKNGPYKREIFKNEPVADVTDPVEKTLFDAIRESPREVDELMRESRFSAAQINSGLMHLQLKGAVVMEGSRVRLPPTHYSPLYAPPQSSSPPT